MDYTEFYYGQIVGLYPFDTDDCRNLTRKVFDHLVDAGISEADIIRVIEESPSKDYLTPDDLPDWLWEGSLLKRNTFYYHNTLHIRAAAPVFNPLSGKARTEKFFMEMKIRYTMDDLSDYFYRTSRISKDLEDKKKDAGSFQYLLNKYSKLDFCEPIDFILSLIDSAKPTESQFAPVRGVLDIAQFESEVYQALKIKEANASLEKANRIIWR